MNSKKNIVPGLISVFLIISFISLFYSLSNKSKKDINQQVTEQAVKPETNIIHLGKSFKQHTRDVKNIPTICMNGVWYYSAEMQHNTYFAPVFKTDSTVALCNDTDKQYTK